MKETFIDVNFRQSSLDQIELCNRIIRQYQAQGFRLTLRQLYYQLVSRDIVPNTERSYKNLGKLISQGRLAGMIDWNAIEDRLRAPHKITEWDTPADIMNAVVRQYQLPRRDRTGAGRDGSWWELALPLGLRSALGAADCTLG